MKWIRVRVTTNPTGTTIANPDGTVRSLNPATPAPWTDGGSYGPYAWTAMPAGTAAQYELCAVDGGRLCYDPTGREPVIFGFVERDPIWPEFSAMTVEPL